MGLWAPVASAQSWIAFAQSLPKASGEPAHFRKTLAQVASQFERTPSRQSLQAQSRSLGIFIRGGSSLWPSWPKPRRVGPRFQPRLKNLVAFGSDAAGPHLCRDATQALAFLDVRLARAPNTTAQKRIRTRWTNSDRVSTGPGQNHMPGQGPGAAGHSTGSDMYNIYPTF